MFVYNAYVIENKVCVLKQFLQGINIDISDSIYI